MTGWHDGPLCGFDVESTGVDPETARIVTASVIWRGTPQDGDAGWLVNPGIDIPEQATAIHGITTQRAQADGADPAQAVAEICEHLKAAMGHGWPLVIYNAVYDLTVLDRETRRHSLQPFAQVFEHCQGLVVDPLVLDKHLDPYRKGRRTLTAACAHYGVTLGDAHNAAADALAAMRVAWKIARRYPAAAGLPLAGLHDLQVKAKAVQAASLQAYLRRQGNTETVSDAWPLQPPPEGEPA